MARDNQLFRAAFNRLLDRLTELTEGDRLEPEAKLARDAGVSRTTIRAALAEMEARGILSTDAGRRHLARMPRAEDRFAEDATHTPSERVAQQMLELILAGDLPPGTELTETELARRFDASQGVVRELLIRFAPFGLIRKQPNRRWVLNGLTRAFAEEMFEIRLMFERRAMSRLTARGLSEAERDDLTAMLLRHRAVVSGSSGKALAFPRMDAEFHAWLCRAAQNRFIADFAEKIALIVHHHYRWNKSDEIRRNREAAAEHVAIIEALLAGQYDEAQTLLDQHLAGGYRTLLASVRWQEPDATGRQYPGSGLTESSSVLGLVQPMNQMRGEARMGGQTAVGDLRETLRLAIVQHHQPGDLLPNERELAELYGVARNTVRETLIHLEAFGMIERTRRGARVRKPDFGSLFGVFAQYFDNSPRSLDDVLLFRRIVETGAAPLAVQNCTPAIIARMEEANARMGTAPTISEGARHDYDFHFCIVEATGNEVLIRMYRVLATALRYYLEVGKSLHPETHDAGLQHARIIAALKDRDAGRLRQELALHFEISGRVFAALIAKQAAANSQE